MKAVYLPSPFKVVTARQTRVGSSIGQQWQNFSVMALSRVVIATAASYLCSSAFLELPVRAQLADATQPSSPFLDWVREDRDAAEGEGNNRAAIGNETSRRGNVLQPGDELELTVLGFPDLSGRQTILEDGSVQLPLVGNVLVVGLTPNQAVEKLTTNLTPYVRRPQVGLVLLNSRPPQVSVTGEVRRPGAHLLVPPENNPNDGLDASSEEVQTLTYALISAGGVTPNADLRNVLIRRRLLPTNPSSLVSREREEIRVNLWDLIQEGDLSADVRVYNGDEIVVPTARLTSGDRERLLESTLAPESISVQVAGGVQSPGQLQIAPDANIVTAVIAAGGFNADARKDEIALFRVSSEGRLEQETYEFGDVSEPLEDGDVIVVGTKKRRLRRALGVLGSILNPFGAIFD